MTSHGGLPPSDPARAGDYVVRKDTKAQRTNKIEVRTGASLPTGKRAPCGQGQGIKVLKYTVILYYLKGEPQIFKNY